MFEHTENIEVYHDVVARSLISIIEQLGRDSKSNAKKIIRFNIMQAYVIYCMDNAEESAKLLERANTNKENKTNSTKEQIAFEVKTIMKECNDKDVDELLADMFIYQSLAGIKPVQNTAQRARVWERVKGRLGP